jgi:uncharacterized protein YlxP (DUF503 family)
VSGEPAFVVLMRVHLHFPDVGSLKGKRAELNRVKAHLRERGSRPVVGSSRNISRGVTTMLAAMSSRRRMPPE